MKKSKIVSLLFTFAVILSAQIVLGISAYAGEINGTTTTMSFDVLGGGGSYAPYTLNINPAGEYCTRDTTLTLQINNISASYGIQNVYFVVTGYSYPGYPFNPGSQVTIQGGSISQGSCWGQLSWSDIPEHDGYTVKAYAVDTQGNNYTWTKTVKQDILRPTIEYPTITSNDRYMIASDGNPIVNSDVRLNFTVQDKTPYYTSWIKGISVKVYDSTQTQPIRTITITPNNPSNKNCGGYSSDIALLNLGNTQKTLTARITVTDYANNTTTVSKRFYYDRKYTTGRLSKGTPTASTVDCYFDTYSDISGLMYCKFIFTTLENGQPVSYEIYGTKVSSTRWKATLDKTTFNSSTGSFNIEVWSRDLIENYGLVGTLTHQF